MTEKSISTPNGIPTLTVIAGRELVQQEEHEQAILIPLKKTENKPEPMMPPQPEMYIKAKKHDFF